MIKQLTHLIRKKIKAYRKWSYDCEVKWKMQQGIYPDPPLGERPQSLKAPLADDNDSSTNTNKFPTIVYRPKYDILSIRFSNDSDINMSDGYDDDIVIHYFMDMCTNTTTKQPLDNRIVGIDIINASKRLRKSKKELKRLYKGVV